MPDPYWPLPWKVADDEQCGKVIEAANGWKVYAWPNYITEETRREFPDSPAKQFDFDGVVLCDSHMEQMVAAVNAQAELVALVESLLEYAEMAQDEGPANGEGWKSRELEASLEKARELLARVKG